jgi:hypothetical protein
VREQRRMDFVVIVENVLGFRPECNREY